MIPNNYIPGVDISSIQGSVNFTQLAKVYQFAIFRCHVGNDFKDKLYETNMQSAQDAGLKVATYHFAYPLPEVNGKINRNPKDQAALHYSSSQQNPGPVVLDLEWPYPQDWKKWQCNATQIMEWAKVYLQEFEDLSGKRPLIYTYPNFAQTVNLSAEFAEYDLWIASYTQKPVVPKPWTDWVIWQNTGGSQTFNGVKMDTNFCKDLSIFDA